MLSSSKCRYHARFNHQCTWCTVAVFSLTLTTRGGFSQARHEWHACRKSLWLVLQAVNVLQHRGESKTHAALLESTSILTPDLLLLLWLVHAVILEAVLREMLFFLNVFFLQTRQRLLKVLLTNHTILPFPVTTCSAWLIGLCCCSCFLPLSDHRSYCHTHYFCSCCNWCQWSA